METQPHDVGTVLIDRYQILSILGQGGLGITYGARRLSDGTPVAVKSLNLRSSQSWKAMELFEREAKVLAHLRHPGIPAYVDYFQTDTATDRHFYIVQELVEGQSLTQMVDNGWHGSESEVRAIAQKLLEILAYLHGLRPPVIHRDIKPQNVIRRSDGTIFLVDFGAVQDTYRQTEVGSSTIVGTYGFMAPEQFRGKATPQTDLYGLGTTVLYLLTGRSPANLPEKKLRIDFRAAVAVSEALAQWLDRMLEPAYEDRFPSAQEALIALTAPTSPDTTAARSRDDVAARLRPRGSTVKLIRDGSVLNVVIPPLGINETTASFFAFALFWIGFLVLWTFAASRGGVFALLSIPFWFVGLIAAYTVLRATFGTAVLYVDARRFRLTHRLWQHERIFSGVTEDLNGAAVRDTGLRVNKQKITAVRLQYGIQHADFGSFLTGEEKAWLAAEIQSFLESLKAEGKI
jgi:hypothetical protein